MNIRLRIYLTDLINAYVETNIWKRWKKNNVLKLKFISPWKAAIARDRLEPSFRSGSQSGWVDDKYVIFDIRNMACYRDIHIRQMSEDFNRVRNELNIEKWLVFCGSWGSTLGLDYAQWYPKDCPRLIICGIFLSMEDEMNNGYTSKAIEALAEK